MTSLQSAACVSKLRSPLGSVTQGCLLRVQKCTVGRSQEVSSSVPARMVRSVPGGVAPGGGPLQIQAPHSGQSQCVLMRPLSAR